MSFPSRSNSNCPGTPEAGGTKMARSALATNLFEFCFSGGLSSEPR